MRDRKNPLRLRTKIIFVVVGILIGLGMVEISLRAGNYLFVFRQTARNEQARKQPAASRIMCLGESTTAIGGEDSYPAQLERILRKRKRNAAFAVINKGLPACNSSTITQELEQNIARYQPNIIVVMMGINDDFPLMAKDELIEGVPLPPSRRRLQISVLLDWVQDGLSRALQIIYPHRTRQLREEDASAARKIVRGTGQQRSGGEIIVAAVPETSLKSEEKPEQSQSSRSPLVSAMSQEEERAFELGVSLRERKQYEEATQIFMRMLTLDPRQERAYEALRVCFIDRGEYDAALAVFAQLETTYPEQLWPIYYRGHVLLEKAVARQGERSLLEQSVVQFERVLARDPRHFRSCQRLGLAYRHLLDPRSARMFARALELNPGDGESLFWLTLDYEEQEDPLAARQAVERILAQNARNPYAYEWMGNYRLDKEHDYAAAAKMFEQVLAIVPDHERVMYKLARCYEKLQAHEPLSRLSGNLADMRNRLFRPGTLANYRRVASISAQHDIRLVCVSYPCRSVAMVRNALRDFRRVSYVDNEQSFKDALQGGQYEDYFIDSFAGDFGHCTAKGNRLLAENVADVIVREDAGKISR